MKNINTKKLTGVAIVLAIEIILQVFGNFLVSLSGVNINLSLIPIAIGAIVYGPFAGGLLGLVNGVIVLFSPSTQAIFFQYAPLGTVLTCLLKCTIAGLMSGLVYILLKNKNEFVATVIAALLVPVLNTGLFALGAFTVMLEAIKANNSGNENVLKFVFLTMIGLNFIIELAITTVLTPTVEKIRKIMTRSNKHAL